MSSRKNRAKNLTYDSQGSRCDIEGIVVKWSQGIVASCRTVSTAKRRYRNSVPERVEASEAICRVRDLD